MSTTVRVSDETHERLATLAGATGRQMNAILEEAVADFEARTFWDAFNEAYDQIAADPEQWADVQAERAAWAPTLKDGLENDPDTAAP